MTVQKLDPRLETAAQFVRSGAVFADIGTDHAYLPIALLQRGVVSRAVAADIAEGPLLTAREHLEACAEEYPSLHETLELVRTDGLAGLEHHEPPVTDIAVCGMGGELIARILSDAPFVFDPDIRLILQPMTMQPYLRRWLGDAMFAMDGERLCKTQNGKLYSVICCHFSGQKPEDRDDYWGAALLADPANRVLLPEYITAKKENLERIVCGKKTAGTDCTWEERELQRAVCMLKEM